MARVDSWDLQELVEEARTIELPGWKATTLAKLATRAHPRDAAQIWEEIRALLKQINRPSRLAEVLADLLKLADDRVRAPIVAEGIRLLEAQPDGEWTAACIAVLATHADGTGRRTLLARALRTPGFEIECARSVLRAASRAEVPHLRATIEGIQDAALRARLLGFLAAHSDAAAAAWAIEDAPARAEALRVLAYQAPATELDALAASTEGRAPADSARFLSQLGARADKLRDAPRTRELLAQALTAAKTVDDPKQRAKVAGKLAQALERADLDPTEALALAESTPEEADEGPRAAPTQVVVRGGSKGTGRHTLALVDGYSGGLRAPHLRAIARAAPLCVAFDLDLVLMGFPSDDAQALVAATTAETNIGEGARYAAELLAEGRLSLAGIKDMDWDRLGTPVATTPHPVADRIVTDLAAVPAPICLLVGLGRQGLPKFLLNTSGHHYELTGRGISLETATAMGILAERLGRISA